jgi:hypothetical protein
MDARLVLTAPVTMKPFVISVYETQSFGTALANASGVQRLGWSLERGN